MPKAIVALVILLAALIASPGLARTITLTASACDEMAVLSPTAPRVGWAMHQNGPRNVFNTNSTLYWDGRMTVLMRFPVNDLIPAGQRITKAEFTIVADYVAGSPVVQIRRMLAEWGVGVCHQYRMTYPHKLEWAQPGARGAAVDLAAKDTAIIRVPKVGEYTVDVTEDIELWYTGAAANRGWLLAFDAVGSHIYMPSPYVPADANPKGWKLQITFEPK